MFDVDLICALFRIDVISRIPPFPPELESNVGASYGEYARDLLFTKAINGHLISRERSPEYLAERKKYLTLK